MPTTNLISIDQLKLDLSNFRTVPQANELHAVQVMISISPDRFWALMESLVDDGYLPTENILVLKTGDSSEMIVKEGNRRVAALKLIHGYLSSSDISIPDNIISKIKNLPAEWKTTNARVPCAIYAIKDASLVDKIVTLTHGKGEKAGRDHWTAVARARHNRDVNKLAEPALDLLEKYLINGKNLTPQQAERWSGNFSLSVLDEAIKKISTRFGVSSAPDLARKYPSIQHRDVLEDILKNIGLEIIGFPIIRDKKEDFATKYGPPTAPMPPPTGNTSPQNTPSAGASTGAGGQSQGTQGTAGSGQGGQNTTGAVQGGQGVPTGTKTAAVAIHDPRAVMRALRTFVPSGNNRQKVVTLRDEARKLKLKDNPIAFCFLLRSMFEISAKAYCDDHKASGGPSCTKPDGNDKNLAVVLGEITAHLTNQKTDKAKIKALHGAMTELGKPEGILSVTSMNQLVHNPQFSIAVSDIAAVFGNIFPLLEAMNQ